MWVATETAVRVEIQTASIVVPEGDYALEAAKVLCVGPRRAKHNHLNHTWHEIYVKEN